MVKKRRAVDPDARPLPGRVIFFLFTTAVSSVVFIAFDWSRLSSHDYEQHPVASVFKIVSSLSACMVAFSMGHLDQLESHDGSKIGGAFVAVMAGVLCFSAGVDKGGIAAFTLFQAALAWRNSRGLYVAWRKGLLPVNRMTEAAVGVGATVAAALILITPQMGDPTLTGFVAAYAATLIVSVLVAVAATYTRHFPDSNTRDMLWGLLLFSAGDVTTGGNLVLAQDSAAYAVCSSLTWMLYIPAILLISTSAYRRVKRSAGNQL